MVEIALWHDYICLGVVVKFHPMVVLLFIPEGRHFEYEYQHNEFVAIFFFKYGNVKYIRMNYKTSNSVPLKGNRGWE